MSQIGAIFAIAVVTNKRRPIFIQSSLADVVAHEIGYCDNEGRTETLAWVVMPDHLHWMTVLRRGSLGDLLCAFKSRSAREINRLAGSSGLVWQAGYYDHHLRSDEDLRAQALYIIENPLRKGLAANVEQYPHWACRWISSSTGL